MRLVRKALALCVLTGACALGVAINASVASTRDAAEFGPFASAGPVVRPAVAAAVQTQTWVRVLVSLREPKTESGAPASRLARRDEVKARQDDLLAHLTDSDFRTVYRYAEISGVAGYVSAEGALKLAGDPDVLAVTVDGTVAGADTLSVPLIDADDVQALGYTGNGVVVAVLDSGVDTDHPDLADRILSQECFLSGGGCPGGGPRASGPGAAEDDQGHGTHVTGIIASQGIVGPRGVAPGANIAAYKVTNAQSQGYVSDIDAALDDIIAHHPEIRIINMSLVSPETFQGTCDDYSPTTSEAISMLWNAGTISFVAAGNDAVKNGMTFPACVSSAVSVGAVWDADYGSVQTGNCTDSSTAADQVTCFSNSDSALDLLAPGAVIVSDFLNGATVALSGTSMATPHAAGVAALLLQSEPSLAPSEVLSRLESGGVPIIDSANGLVTPRVDAIGTLGLSEDMDGDGCSNAGEAVLGLDPRDQWDFYSVPVPALFAAPDPLIVSKDNAVSASDAQAVFAYFKRAAKTGTPEYEQDLNANGVRDGIEYDRSVVAPGVSGAPDGVVAASDAQLAFAQFKMGHHC